jgi:hypothetical protein
VRHRVFIAWLAASLPALHSFSTLSQNLRIYALFLGAGLLNDRRADQSPPLEVVENFASWLRIN